MERIEQVRAAAKEYGRCSIENYKLMTKLGRDIISSFDRYLSPARGLVFGVPPKGEWDSNVEYRDDAFSHDPILTVGTIEFGLAIRIFEKQELRQIVGLRKDGDQIFVFVTDSESQKLRIPVDYTSDDLDHVCEQIFQNVLLLFSGHVRAYVHGNEGLMTIGFNVP
jgi:hypothetical protein